MKAAPRAEEAQQGMYTGWERPVNTQHIDVVGYRGQAVVPGTPPSCLVALF